MCPNRSERRSSRNSNRLARRLGVAVIGCGLIGGRRAAEASAHPRTRMVRTVDADAAVAEAAAARFQARSGIDWQAAVSDPDVDIVCVATPNMLLAPIAVAAAHAGKHVLLEKPMGRNLTEAQAIAGAARAGGVKVKIGFNHRYHPAIARAFAEFTAGRIGSVINIRARYGHGGRPGYEREWRGSREAAGGGELTDQGVHIADLIGWFAGMPDEAFAVLQTAVWPLGDLEDNAFGLFRFSGGSVASFHTSWTQWKNLFSLEIFGERGSLSIEGLGKSYGVERLIVADRVLAGGAPAMHETAFDGPDDSWKHEWADFIGAIDHDATYLGTPEDGLRAMTMIDALYASARAGVPYRIEAAVSTT
jgi:predicted dehydrogenase